MAALAAALLGTACGGKATAPSATTPPVAAPTVTEVFNGILPLGASRFFSFTVGVNGTVNVTLVTREGSRLTLRFQAASGSKVPWQPEVPAG